VGAGEVLHLGQQVAQLLGVEPRAATTDRRGYVRDVERGLTDHRQDPRQGGVPQ
jgi:hypothetical protein